MSGEISESVIAVGYTDGARFVAIKPPLNESELNELRDQNLIRGQVEHIDVEPACTQISFSSLHTSPESATRRAQGIALAIAEALRVARHRNVGVDLSPISLMGFKSSPFNPNTDKLRQHA